MAVHCRQLTHQLATGIKVKGVPHWCCPGREEPSPGLEYACSAASWIRRWASRASLQLSDQFHRGGTQVAGPPARLRTGDDLLDLALGHAVCLLRQSAKLGKDLPANLYAVQKGIAT